MSAQNPDLKITVNIPRYIRDVDKLVSLLELAGFTSEELCEAYHAHGMIMRRLIERGLLDKEAVEAWENSKINQALNNEEN